MREPEKAKSIVYYKVCEPVRYHDLLWLSSTRVYSVGKVEVMSLYLPVVAMGLIPHIYQRAGLALGYPYSGCHASWDNISCFTIFIFAFAELLQSQEPELQAEVFYADFPVVSIVLPLPLHGSQTHPRP